MKTRTPYISFLFLLVAAQLFLVSCGGGPSPTPWTPKKAPAHIAGHFKDCVPRSPRADDFVWSGGTLFSAGDVGRSSSIGAGSVNISYYDATAGDLVYASDSTGAWVKTTVDSAGNVGQGSTLSFDSSGFAHIAYYDATNSTVKYATNKTGSWVKSTVDDAISGDYNIAVAEDNAGKAHLAYVDTSNNLVYATNKTGPWVYTTLENVLPPAIAGGSAIALDSNEKVHISYAADLALRYATNASGAWVVLTIAENTGLAYDTDIAINSEDGVHIAYATVDSADEDAAFYHVTNSYTDPVIEGDWLSDEINMMGGGGYGLDMALGQGGYKYSVHFSYPSVDNRYLMYTTLADCFYASYAVEGMGLPGNYSSIMLDPATDDVHISHYDASTGDLRYMTTAEVSTPGELLGVTRSDPGYLVGNGTAIAVGSAHISYYDGANGDLEYATNKTGPWVLSTIDSSGDVGKHSSIAVDAASGVHVAYRDESSGMVKYAYKAVGTWAISSIENAGLQAGDNFIDVAIDSLGKAHMCYFRQAPSRLVYATNATGAWVMTEIDNPSVPSGYCSIALDSLDRAHISYYAAVLEGDLKYATNATGSWVVEDVDSDSDNNIGLFNSIAMDSNDKAHIAYHDESAGRLLYATNKDGYWDTVEISTMGDIGEYASIALDSSDLVHISSCEREHEDLRYSTNAYGGWTFSTLDYPGDVGCFSSIAVDSIDTVHISYHDATNESLKYITFLP